MSGNCDWALRYAETGIAIFPCTADSRKKPLVKWRTHSTTDGLIITEWWSAWPESMVGIDLHKCGLVVFDADGHSKDVDGVVALSELLQKHDTDLTQVPISRTPNNGLHFYFRQPDKLLGNREGDLPDGINVRGCGGFVIAPYCIRPDGKSYRGVPGHPDLITAFKTGIIPVLPAWLVDIIQAQSRRMPARSPAPAPIIKVSHDGRREAAYARAALTGCVNDLACLPQNTRRNIALNGGAYRMGRMVARGWIPRDEVEQQLREAATACGLTAEDGHRAVEATLQSGLNAGISQPYPDLKDRLR